MRNPLYALIPAMLWLAVPDPVAAQTHEQTNAVYQGTTAKTVGLTFTKAVKLHDLVVVHIDWDKQASSVTSVTDNLGNLYRRIGTALNWSSANRSDLWYAYNAKAGATTITATLDNRPASYLQMYASEFSGIAWAADPLDKYASDADNGLWVSTPVRNAAYDHDLVYGAAVSNGWGLTNTGWLLSTLSTLNANVIGVTSTTLAGATQQVGLVFNLSGDWVAHMASFATLGTVSTLPIVLERFTAACAGGKIDVKWTTSEEYNNDHFTIERSADGLNWLPVGLVKSGGDRTTPQSYEFFVTPETGAKTLLRLKQTDLDGREETFRVVMVPNCQAGIGQVLIYPNPTSGAALAGVFDDGTGEPFQVIVVDLAGRVAGRYAVANAYFSIPLAPRLSPGIYHVQFVSRTKTAAETFCVAY